MGFHCFKYKKRLLNAEAKFVHAKKCEKERESLGTRLKTHLHSDIHTHILSLVPLLHKHTQHRCMLLHQDQLTLA